MRKFTLFLSLFFAMALTAMAQSTTPVLRLTEIGTAPYQLSEEDAAKVFALTDLTIALKVNTPSAMSGRKALFCTSDPTKAANVDAMPAGSAYVAYGTNEATTAYLASCKAGDRFTTGSIPAGKEDVVLVYVLNPTENNFKAYINGVAVMDRNFGTYEIATPAMVKEDHADAAIYIGGGMTAEGAMEVFEGQITAVEVYDGALPEGTIANLFAPSDEEVAAARAALKEATDKAAALLSEANLTVETSNIALQVTDQTAAGYLWANYPEPNEGPIAALIDGDTGSFFHTQWSNPVPQDTHWIQIDLGEGNTIQNFAFNYHTRVFNGGNDFPDAIEVQGSTNGTEFTTITKIESGLPQSPDVAWNSPVIFGSENYTSLRFLVTAERIYWHMSEFALLNATAKVADDFANVLNDVAALDAMYKSIMANEAMSSIKEMNAAAEALAALIATVEAGHVTPEPEPEPEPTQPTTAEFDFANPTTLDPSVTPNETVSAGIEFDDVTFTNNGVSVNVNKGSATTKVRIWTKKGPAYELRTYNGSTITISAPVGAKLTKVTFEGGKVATMTAEGLANGTWTGEAEKLEIAVTGTLNVTAIKVELAVEGGISVAAPVPSVASGVYPSRMSVSFSTEIAGLEEGAQYSLAYYYTENGEEPTAESNRMYGSYYVVDDCSLKVIAVLTVGEDVYVSPVTEVSYVISEMKPFTAVKSVDEIVEGQILIVAGNLAALSLDGKQYGYLNAREVEVKGAFVEDMLYYAFELEAADGGYYIKDANGKYLYLKGTYNSFNVSDEVPAEGGVWSIAIAEDGTATITNVAMNKYIQYSTNYSSYGAYDTAQEGAIMPTIYVAGEYPELSYSPTSYEMLSSLKEFIFFCEAGLAVDEEAGVPMLYDPMSSAWNEEIGDYVYTKFYELNATVYDETTIVLSLPEEISGEGMYQLNIPAGYFVLDPNGLAIASDGINDYYSLVDMSPLTIESTTPAQGVVESLSRIKIDFSHNIGEVYTAIPVLNAAGDTVCMAEPTFQDAEGNWYNDYSLVDFVLETEITEVGTYSLVIPANYINKTSDGSFFEGATLTFQIKGLYDPYFNEQKTRNDRLLNGVTLISEAFANESANTLVVNNEPAMTYGDYTTTVTMKAAPGETVTLDVDVTGSWMHSYAYIDVDGNGFESSIAEGSDWQPAGDLVSYSFYNNGNLVSDEMGWNSVGEMLTGDSRNTAALPAFNVPTEPGLYRVRVKVDWSNIDPNGDNDGAFGDFMGNGGQIIDFMLEVAEAPAKPFEVVSVEPANESTVSSLTVITVTFSHEITSAILLPGVDTYALTGEDGSSHEAHFSIEGNVLTFELIDGIYEAGVYTLAIPKYLFTRAEDGEVFNGAKFTFTVDGTLSGIDAVGAEDGEQVIYDVNGRRVKKITAKGVYIINGKKVLVK